MNNLKDDAMILMPDNNGYPVIQSGAVCYVGSAGTGKTTSMNKLLDQYVLACNKSTVDLNNPFLPNGPVTHVFYVSPSVKTDMTLRRASQDKILVEATNDNIEKLT